LADQKLESKNELQKIASRVRTYTNAVFRAHDYVEENAILDVYIATNLLTISILWVAAVRGETLTDEDLCMFLGIEDTSGLGVQEVNLKEKFHDWSLDEVLDFAYNNLR